MQALRGLPIPSNSLLVLREFNDVIQRPNRISKVHGKKEWTPDDTVWSVCGFKDLHGSLQQVSGNNSSSMPDHHLFWQWSHCSSPSSSINGDLMVWCPTGKAAQPAITSMGTRHKLGKQMPNCLCLI